MSVQPLSEDKLNNAFFNILTPAQKEMLSDFGKNMYSNFEKYKTPQPVSSNQSSVKLTDDEEIEWLVQQIKSGLQHKDIDKRGKKLLKSRYGKDWIKILF